MGRLVVISYLVISFCFADDASVKLRMQQFSVVPDVIDTAPLELLQVTYPSGVVADLGNELTPRQVKDIPILAWPVESDALYTLLLTDPDAPVHLSEFRHWLVVNIPGTEVRKGQIVFDYVGSGPPKGTGLHRYIFLVFKQPGFIRTETHVPNTTREGRTKTKARDLVAEYNLGIPVAGNFYRAQFDDYVPLLHTQLGGVPPKA